METDQGSGGHTCGETTVDLTWLTTRNGEIPSSFRHAVKKGAVMLSSGNSYM